MATTVTEELFRVRYMIEGQQGVEVLRQSLERQKATLNQLVALYKDAGLSEQTFTNASNRLAASIARTSQEMERLQRAAGIGAGGGGGGRGGGSQMGVAFLNLGYAIEDLNYGFAGLLNNLPGVAAGLGASTGLVGAIAAAGGAAYMLYRNWDNLMKLVGAGIPLPALKGFEQLEANLAKVGKRLEELRQQGSLTFPEFVEFGRLQDEQAQAQRRLENAQAVKGVRGILNNEQRQNIQGFEGAVQQFGAENVINALQNQIGRNVLGLQGTDEEKVAELIRMIREGRFDAFNEAMRLLDGTQIGQALTEGGAAGKQRKSIIDERNAFADALKEQADEQKKKDKELSLELNAQGQQLEVDGRQGTVNDAMGRLGDVRGRVRLGIQRGNTDDQIVGRLVDLLVEQGADPQFAKRRADEMVKEERKAFERDGAGALGKMTGLEDRIRNGLLVGLNETGSSKQAADMTAEALAKELEKQGIAPDEARFQAFKAVEAEKFKLREDMDLGRVGQFDPVRTMGATEWVRSVQDGAQVAKSQLDELKKSNDLLAQIAKQRGLTLE